MSGALEGACTLRNGKSRLRVTYAALTRPTNKDQDRFVAVTHGSSGFVCAICDGHSVHANADGVQHAEAAARHISSDLWKRVAGKLEVDLPDRPDAATAELRGGGMSVDVEPPADPATPGHALALAATESFLAHQRKCEAVYKKRVADKVISLKEKMEAEIGEELTLSLPQEGGTTATALVLHPGGLLVAWVGDSRAVLAVEPAAGGAPVAMALTSDHNTADELERLRLVSKGGSTGIDSMAGHVFVPEAEGGLKVTRSLGDSPFHRGDAISAVPGLRHVRLSSAVRFALVASDGIWDLLSNQQVVDIVVAAIAAHSMRVSEGDGILGGAGAGSAGSSGSSATAAAAAACAAVLEHIERIQAGGEAKSSHVDDRSIALILLTHESVSSRLSGSSSSGRNSFTHSGRNSGAS